LQSIVSMFALAASLTLMQSPAFALAGASLLKTIAKTATPIAITTRMPIRIRLALGLRFFGVGAAATPSFVPGGGGGPKDWPGGVPGGGPPNEPPGPPGPGPYWPGAP
jgi:hypothetical protein